MTKLTKVMQFSYLRIVGLSAFIILVAVVSSPVFSAPNPDAPIQIEADRMESYGSKDMVLFTGNVVAKQKDLIIKADTMTVYYEEESALQKTSGNAQKIEEIGAEGNVTITSGNLSATGDTARFNATENKVKLVGNTRVWRENNLVTGNTVEIDLNTETSIIERSREKGERVIGIFYPGSSEQKEQEQ